MRRPSLSASLVLIVLLGVSLFAPAAASAGDPPRSGVVEAGPPSVAPAIPSGTEAVGDNVDVTDDPRPQNETTIAADPDDVLNLVAGANDYRYGDSDAGFAVSFDGGATWTADTLEGTNDLLGKYDAQGDPAVAAHRGGVFYLSFIDFSRTDDQNRLGVAKSVDGGATWSQLGVVVDHEGPGNHDFEDKEYIAVDDTGGPRDGYVYVTWTRFPVAGGTRIHFSRSSDGGATFSTPLPISDFFSVQGSLPVVGPDGELYVIWQRGGILELDRSPDGGDTWGSDVQVAIQDPIPSPLPGAAFRLNSFPSMAVDRSGGPHHGNLYAVWPDESVSGQGPDIVLSRSTDRGSTWSAPVRVSDDTNGEFQWFPWVAVDPAGDVHVVFFDRRDEPASGRYHTYYARSTDGGLTFGPNVRLSSEVSDSLLDGFSGTFIGDYNGLTASSLGAQPYWTDVRASNANAEGYTVTVDPGPLLGARGACPGSTTIELADGSPAGDVAFLRGSGPGSTVVPGGPCAGIVVDLAGPRLLAVVTADAAGGLEVVRDLPEAACGVTIQAVDLTSCSTSNVVQLP